MWPILHFHANWPEDSYPFDLFGRDISVLKATQEILERVGDVENEMDAWNENNDAMCSILDTEWILSLPTFKASEHASYEESSMLVEDELEKSIVASFLLSLRLIHQTAAICPLTIDGEIVEGSIDPDSISFDGYSGIDTRPPPVFEPEEFQFEDIQSLRNIWSAVIEFRRLDYWMERVYDPLFFRNLDGTASKDAEKQLRELLRSSPSTEDLKIFKDKISSMIEQMKSEEGKGGIWQEFHSKSLRKAFETKEEETFSNRTRIGRALNLFDEGLRLPTLHAFLSMNLVLETLFTIGKSETTYKLATRLAQIVGRNESMEKRKVLYKEAKKVYGARGDIVHGEKLIDTIKEIEAIKDAFILARSSLRCILLSNKLLGLYSHRGTTDRKLPSGERAIKREASDALEEHFLELSLTLEASDNDKPET